MRVLPGRSVPSSSRSFDGARPATRIHEAVTADVRRAAQLLDAGLASFEGAAPTG
ncbi:hypothetical protein [Streptomyces sp. SLBN-8D4]|uniref:hypothetical protein n=1 Tax=Streptomyces sp. SLBN-8D4 TaxID=3377728 RepID=UPI003C7B4D7A